MSNRFLYTSLGVLGGLVVAGVIEYLKSAGSLADYRAYEHGLFLGWLLVLGVVAHRKS